MRKYITSSSSVVLAAVVLTLTAITVRGATSTNFELIDQRTPAAGGDSFSTNYHLVGVIPQQPTDDVIISTNYELDTFFVPQTFEPIDTTPPVITAGPTAVYLSDTRALIEWETDELADGVVDYGLTTAYGNTEVQPGGFTTLHQVLLTGLAAGTTYDYRVSSTDPYSNGPTQSANFQFTTAGAPDTTGPLITDTVTPTSTQSVDITFTTDEHATTDVEHGPTVGLGTSLPDSVFRDSHTRSIGGLTPGATHFYEITATDPTGNSNATGVQNFTLPDDVLITTTTLPDGRDGDTYSELMTATGGVGALTWTVDSGTLPPGIALVPSTGELSGIPSASGTYNFDIRATDSGTPVSSHAVSLQIEIKKKKSGGGGDDDGCSTGTSSGPWMMLCALLALLALTARGFRSRA